ncbi:MAG TPA: hypothetical protein VNW97_07035 [Candidatus Saccharimonadales bacterium]|jgi:hypothetical protein|nr:hypothetical protein [Candidatus Saccharimonadales bacterium]
MNSKLSIIDYALWLSIMLLQLFACWVVIKRGFYATWKAFSYYLFFGAGEAVALFIVARTASAGTYSRLYYAGSFIEAVLLCLVVLEILVKILDPFDALPVRYIAWFCFWAALGISVSAVISIGPLLPNTLSEWTLVTERTIMLCDAVLLWVILFQARSLGIPWRSSVCEIALGFALFLTVQGISKFIFAAFSQSKLLMSYADESGQLAFLVAMAGWVWTMFHRGPLPHPPTAETLTRMRAFTSGAMVTKEKMLAAVGVRIDKVVPESSQEDPESMASNTHPDHAPQILMH